MYSRKEFAGYSTRVILNVCDIDGDNFIMNVYTTRTDKESILDDIKTSISDRVSSIEIEHMATRRQDELDTEMLRDFLENDIL